MHRRQHNKVTHSLDESEHELNFKFYKSLLVLFGISFFAANAVIFSQSTGLSVNEVIELASHDDEKVNYVTPILKKLNLHITDKADPIHKIASRDDVKALVTNVENEKHDIPNHDINAGDQNKNILIESTNVVTTNRINSYDNQSIVTFVSSAQNGRSSALSGQTSSTNSQKEAFSKGQQVSTNSANQLTSESSGNTSQISIVAENQFLPEVERSLPGPIDPDGYNCPPLESFPHRSWARVQELQRIRGCPGI